MKVKLVLNVEPEVKLAVSAEAKRKGTSMSQVCEAILTKGIQVEYEQNVVELFLPAMTSTIKEEFRIMSDRLAKIGARTMLEAAASRRTQFQIMLHNGIPEETAKDIADSAWHGAFTSSQSIAKTVAEIYLAVEEVNRERSQGKASE